MPFILNNQLMKMHVAPQIDNPIVTVNEDFVNNNGIVKRLTGNDDSIIFNKKFIHFLRVNNDAMQEAGICKGDIVIVDRSISAKSGDVIIALLQSSMIIRRFNKVNNRVTLIADFNKLSPVNIENGYEDFSVWGVVTYVMRSI